MKIDGVRKGKEKSKRYKKWSRRWGIEGVRREGDCPVEAHMGQNQEKLADLDSLEKRPLQVLQLRMLPGHIRRLESMPRVHTDAKVGPNCCIIKVSVSTQEIKLLQTDHTSVAN